jgi:hypothetical protein
MLLFFGFTLDGASFLFQFFGTIIPKRGVVFVAFSKWDAPTVYSFGGKNGTFHHLVI